ncbi:basic amino acid ABC transporter substrate-binding protein [Nocardioides sp. CFH 31398]|uniref:basic amino acid ABC transporter substrate-binding protein n=1 Tax=Nocardioides sp. CFH 31398 TaxID=2919579 RepID=UPI001F06C744|nr:basic amino acid ABC transporter substrate-binding protein [Nocardioides sp. CFH 31398]MCH1867148.1 basic amino acid ABC transporter substrate-binding protein [Nocardioides sp. CFH 31398]
MTRSRLRLPGAALAATVLATGLAGCATETTTTESGVELVTDGELTVCTSLPYKPFEFNQDGEVVGFDIDLMDLVAQSEDLEVTVVATGFEGIQSGQSLNTGECDVAAAGMTITDERARVIDFSDPYFEATQALLVPADSDVTSLDDLSGQTLGVQQGTTGELYAEDNAPDDVELRVYEDLGLLTQAVNTGQVDAGINDNGVLYDFANSNDTVEVVAEFDTGEQYGFAVQKDGNPELLELINTTIADAQEDGTYDEIYAEWFGDAPTEPSS